MDEWPYVVWLDEEDRPLKQMSRGPEELAEALQWHTIQGATGVMRHSTEYVAFAILSDVEMVLRRLGREKLESITVSNIISLGALGGSISGWRDVVEGSFTGISKFRGRNVWTGSYDVDVVETLGRARLWHP